ncbi:hypothetical protein DICVIV_06071 [Dictyocaulus viviparus]|uniref:Uncharacterized protein n=1 Tax=Dictyocaulus viviparus TaxID=29172 RepID=A0A0D8XTJ1_DICVI|nr:hypothetical protein DICVIV_06071 [Dictyocaulus viviparus]
MCLCYWWIFDEFQCRPSTDFLVSLQVKRSRTISIFNTDGHLKLAPSTTRDKLRRHESVIVDLKDPKTVPEDFLQLDTLMFDKRTKNNQITHMSNALPLHGMETMPLKKKSTDEKTFPLLAENEDVESNRIISIPRSQRSVTDEYIRINSSQSPLVSDSAISNDQYLSNVATLHEGESEKNTTDVTSEGSGWIEERVTIEPLAEKIIIYFNEFTYHCVYLTLERIMFDFFSGNSYNVMPSFIMLLVQPYGFKLFLGNSLIKLSKGFRSVMI